MTCRSPRALSLCNPHPLDLVFPSMPLEGPSLQLTRRSDSKILNSSPDSHFQAGMITVNLSLLLGGRDTDAYFLVLLRQWNEIRVLQISSKFSTDRPKMCPFHHGSKTISVRSYIDLGSNPNLLTGCLLLDKSCNPLSLSVLICEREMIVTLPSRGRCEKAL